MRKLQKLFWLLIFSAVIALISGFYQRASSEIVEFGNVCSGEEFSQCYRPRLCGGFPFPFVFDNPGISVENTLSAEDEFRWLPFVGNVWFYLLAVVFAYNTLKEFLKT